MEIALLILEYLKALVWPAVATFALWRYRNVIQSLLARSKLKFSIAGVSIETSVETLLRSVTENFRGRSISDEQWRWLSLLKESKERRLPYDHTFYEQLRPLRNTGLIREYPEGTLTAAETIEITTLGELLLEAHFKAQVRGGGAADS